MSEQNRTAAGAQEAAGLASIETRLDAIDASLLGEQDQTNHAVPASLAWGARSDLEHGLWEGAGSSTPRSAVRRRVGPAAR